MSKPKPGKRTPRAIPSPPPLEPLFEKIMEECVRVQRLTFAERMAEHKAGTPFPPTIPVASGQIDTSDEGFKAIGELASRYQAEPPALKAKVSKDTYTKAVLHAVGDSISGIRNRSDATDDNWITVITDIFKETLQARISGTLRDRIEVVPCHIFDSDQAVSTFKVGPVTFYPRPEWLKSLDPRLVRTDLVEDAWANRLSFDKLREMAFTAGSDAPTQGAFPRSSARASPVACATVLQD